MAIEIIIALTMSARALAIVAGLLVCIDSVQVYRGIRERISDPKGDAIVWAELSGMIAVSGLLLILFSEPTVGGQSSLVKNIVVLFVWAGLSLGLTARQAFAQEKHLYTWLSAAIFVAVGTGLQLVGMAQ